MKKQKINIFDKVLFSVTREDYQIEYQTIVERGYKNILTVCSGGCTPLSLKALLDDIKITTFDINPHQIKLIEEKINLTKNKEFVRLNVGVENGKMINQSGEFEKMFLKLRNYFKKHITSKTEIESLFNSSINEETRNKIINKWLKNPKVKVPFQKVFNDKAIGLVFAPGLKSLEPPPVIIIIFFIKKF